MGCGHLWQPRLDTRVHGLLFKNAQAHRPFNKDRECSLDVSRNKAGAAGPWPMLRERLACGDISFLGKLDFSSLILAFTSSIIWLKANSILQCTSHFTVVYSILPGHFQLYRGRESLNSLLPRLKISHRVFHSKTIWLSECK